MIDIKKRKVIAISSLLLLIYTVIIALTLIPSAIAPVWYGSGDDTGLVGRWSCEGNFNDSSGMNNHGTQSGGVTITSGVKGRACGFDGGNDYITVTDVNSLSSALITLSAWIKLNSLGSQDIIAWKGNEYGLQYNTVSGTNCGANRFGFSILNSVDAWNCASSTTQPVIGQWYHLAGVHNGSNILIYVNGVLENSTVWGTPTNRAFNFDIGTFSGVPSTYAVNATIDEVRIYNRSLSASEVASLYNTSKSYYLNFKATPTQGLLNETGLVGYWTFDTADKSNATNATDKSGLQNHGTVTGATFTNEGRFKEGYKFDGVNDFINYSSPLSLALNTSGTVTAWIYNIGISPSAYQLIADRQDWANTRRGYSLWLYNNAGSLVLYGTLANTTAGANSPATSIPDLLNKWHFVTHTWNGTAQQIYIDGIYKNSIAAPAPSGYIYPLLIGRSNTAYLSSYSPFNGTIDEVRIYNRSLSASEVAQLYNGTKSNFISVKATPELGLLNETGLVGKWSMNANDGSNSVTAQDTSGLNNDGTVSGANFTNEGRFKEAYRFDGGDEINLGTPTSLTSLNGSFTYATWFKGNNVNSTCAEQTCAIVGGYTNGAMITTYVSKPRFYLCSSSPSLVGTTTLLNNQWYHLTGTFNGTTLFLYLNGVQEDSDTKASCSFSTTYIGRNALTPSSRFNGTIDEVRIYNRSLTASEVAGLYNGTKSEFIEWKATVG